MKVKIANKPVLVLFCLFLIPSLVTSAGKKGAANSQDKRENFAGATNKAANNDIKAPAPSGKVELCQLIKVPLTNRGAGISADDCACGRNIDFKHLQENSVVIKAKGSKTIPPELQFQYYTNLGPLYMIGLEAKIHSYLNTWIKYLNCYFLAMNRYRHLENATAPYFYEEGQYPENFKFCDQDAARIDNEQSISKPPAPVAVRLIKYRKYSRLNKNIVLDPRAILERPFEQLDNITFNEKFDQLLEAYKIFINANPLPKNLRERRLGKKPAAKGAAPKGGGGLKFDPQRIDVADVMNVFDYVFTGEDGQPEDPLKIELMGNPDAVVDPPTPVMLTSNHKTAPFALYDLNSNFPTDVKEGEKYGQPIGNMLVSIVHRMLMLRIFQRQYKGFLEEYLHAAIIVDGCGLLHQRVGTSKTTVTDTVTTKTSFTNDEVKACLKSGGVAGPAMEGFLKKKMHLDNIAYNSTKLLEDQDLVEGMGQCLKKMDDECIEIREILAELVCYLTKEFIGDIIGTKLFTKMPLEDAGRYTKEKFFHPDFADLKAIYIKDYYQVGRAIQTMHNCENENFVCRRDTADQAVDKILFIEETMFPCRKAAVYAPVRIFSHLIAKMALTRVFEISCLPEDPWIPIYENKEGMSYNLFCEEHMDAKFGRIYMDSNDVRSVFVLTYLVDLFLNTMNAKGYLDFYQSKITQDNQLFFDAYSKGKPKLSASYSQYFVNCGDTKMKQGGKTGLKGSAYMKAFGYLIYMEICALKGSGSNYSYVCKPTRFITNPTLQLATETKGTRNVEARMHLATLNVDEGGNSPFAYSMKADKEEVLMGNYLSELQSKASNKDSIALFGDELVHKDFSYVEVGNKFIYSTNYDYNERRISCKFSGLTFRRSLLWVLNKAVPDGSHGFDPSGACPKNADAMEKMRPPLKQPRKKKPKKEAIFNCVHFMIFYKMMKNNLMADVGLSEEEFSEFGTAFTIQCDADPEPSTGEPPGGKAEFNPRKFLAVYLWGRLIFYLKFRIVSTPPDAAFPYLFCFEYEVILSESVKAFQRCFTGSLILSDDIAEESLRVLYEIVYQQFARALFYMYKTFKFRLRPNDIMYLFLDYFEGKLDGDIKEEGGKLKELMGGIYKVRKYNKFNAGALLFIAFKKVPLVYFMLQIHEASDYAIRVVIKNGFTHKELIFERYFEIFKEGSPDSLGDDQLPTMKKKAFAKLCYEKFLELFSIFMAEKLTFEQTLDFMLERHKNEIDPVTYKPLLMDKVKALSESFQHTQTAAINAKNEGLGLGDGEACSMENYFNMSLISFPLVVLTMEAVLGIFDCQKLKMPKLTTTIYHLIPIGDNSLSKFFCLNGESKYTNGEVYAFLKDYDTPCQIYPNYFSPDKGKDDDPQGNFGGFIEDYVMKIKNKNPESAQQFNYDTIYTGLYAFEGEERTISVEAYGFEFESLSAFLAKFRCQFFEMEIMIPYSYIAMMSVNFLQVILEIRTHLFVYRNMTDNEENRAKTELSLDTFTGLIETAYAAYPEKRYFLCMMSPGLNEPVEYYLDPNGGDSIGPCQFVSDSKLIISIAETLIIPVDAEYTASLSIDHYGEPGYVISLFEPAREFAINSTANLKYKLLKHFPFNNEESIKGIVNSILHRLNENFYKIDPKVSEKATKKDG